MRETLSPAEYEQVAGLFQKFFPSILMCRRHKRTLVQMFPCRCNRLPAVVTSVLVLVSITATDITRANRLPAELGAILFLGRRPRNCNPPGMLCLGRARRPHGSGLRFYFGGLYPIVSHPVSNQSLGWFEWRFQGGSDSEGSVRVCGRSTIPATGFARDLCDGLKFTLCCRLRAHTARAAKVFPLRSRDEFEIKTTFLAVNKVAPLCVDRAQCSRFMLSSELSCLQ